MCQARGAYEGKFVLRPGLAGIGDRVRLPLRSGDVRCRVGRQLTSVDGDAPAAALHQPRGRQPNGSTAQHGAATRTSGVTLKRQLHGQVRGSPRQSHAGATVPVVVHNQQLVEPLRLYPEAAATERAQTDHGADLTFWCHLHARQPAPRIVEKGVRPKSSHCRRGGTSRRRGGTARSVGRRAAAETQPKGPEAPRPQQAATIHQRTRYHPGRPRRALSTPGVEHAHGITTRLPRDWRDSSRSDR